MKAIIFLLLVVVSIFVGSSQAQCRSPPNPSCVGGRNEGRGGRGCRAATAWYYNAQQRRCLSMRYRGCGGNNNRYCSLAACQRRCTR